MRALARASLFALGACASALHEPPPVAALAPGHANGRTTDELLHEADEAWQRHSEPGQAAAAQQLYLDAAASNDRRVEALIGAMKVVSYRIERDTGIDRGKLSELGVELGQWCQRRAPTSGECDYRLAIALGQQARERPSTGKDALDKIVDLLHRAITREPGLDLAGPHRILALVLLRAPSWPIGPGDPDAALVEARAAVRMFPDAAENQLALAEALVATNSKDAARATYARALAFANAANDRGDPDAATWIAEARAGLAHTGR